MKKIITAIAFTTFSLVSMAQDVHFTMFHIAPTVLNPGTAGMFDGTFRASSNYRSQWGSICSPYRTISFTADGSLWKNSGKNAYMGVGLSAYNDVAGSANLGTTRIDLTVSSILNLDNYNTLSVGLKGGWAQQSISEGDLQWDSQFNGQEFDPSLPTYEDYQFTNSSFFDFGTGVVWAYGTEASNLASFDKVTAQVGLAYHHVMRPKMQTYYGTQGKLYSRFVLHADMNYSSGYSRLAIRPRLAAYLQGPAREVNVGVMFRYLVADGSKYTGNIKGLAISLGSYYRIGDAFAPSVEVELAGFTFGYSYDFNASGLRVASNGWGGSEFFIRFQNPNPFFKFSRRPSWR